MGFVAKKVTENVPPNRWIASLSNGETIFEDIVDGKQNAWLRLKTYIHENNLQITQLRFQFTHRRDHCGNSIVKKNAVGYIHLKKYQFNGFVGYTSYAIGYVENSIAYLIWHREDGTVWPEQRSLEKCGFGLINNE